MNKANAQEIQFCGAHVQPNSNAAGSQQGPVVYDRFGNAYAVDELQNMSAKGKLVNCNTPDIFRLNFIGNFPADEEATICQVFQDVSALIAGGSLVQVPIDIIREPMTYVAPATASDFYTGQCGLANSTVLQLVRTGQNTLPLGVAAGVMHVRQNPTPATTWYSLQDQQQQPNINNNQVDLYSVALHEALHILGFASLIGRTGASITGNNIYSNWDRFLTAGQNNARLIVPNQNGGCCNAHQFNTPAFPFMPQPLSGGCGINLQFRVGNNNIAPVNIAGMVPTNNGDMANKLSHLERTCTNINYVMHSGSSDIEQPCRIEYWPQQHHGRHQ